MYKALVENQIGKKIKVLVFDNGGELCENNLIISAKSVVLHDKKRTPYTPQQNGLIERMNRSLMEKARSMLSGVGLGQELWEVVVDIACYLKNRSPTLVLVNKNPHEVWSGKKPSISHLRVFG